ncbi:MAG: PspA/IM30 family protein, partial [bacterium]
MFKRLLNVIKSWLGFGIDKLENPELLLQQAQEEMKAAAARNRERAVQAITQKNNLQQMVDDLQKTVDNLQAKAELSLKRGDRDLALQLLKEKQNYDQSLQSTRAQLEAAIETAEQVKLAIKREEEKIREKTAQALALKA